MANLGVDFSFARLSAADIKAQGYGFVGRYLSSVDSKRITQAEVTDFQSENLGIVLFWEDEADAALNGFAQGVHDAQEALNQAGAINWPGNLPIFFTADFDATEAQQAQIDDYLRGASSVIGLERTGIYGGYYVVKRCLDNGTATFACQTVAWSGGQVDPRAHIYQNGDSAFGGNADIDEAKQTNFGQWSQGGIVEPTDYRANEGDNTNVKVEFGFDPSTAPDLSGQPWSSVFYNWINGKGKALQAQNEELTRQVNDLTAKLNGQPVTTPTKPLPQLDPMIIPKPQTSTVSVSFGSGAYGGHAKQTWLQKLWKVIFG